MEKSTLLGLFFIVSFVSKAQELDINKIDTSNYYDYNILKNPDQQNYLKSKDITGFFLKKYEAAYIINDELLKTGHTIHPNVLYKLDNKQYITLDAYDLDKDIGYIYVEIVRGGGKEMRSIKSPYLESHKADYMQFAKAKGGEMVEVNIIKELPDNIKIIWAEWYWFQFTENKDDDKYLISKKVIEKILRQDIRKFYK